MGHWDEGMDDEDYEALLWEEFLHQADNQDNLTEAEWDVIRPFMLKTEERLSVQTFNCLKDIFPKHNTPSWKHAQSIMACLSTFCLVIYHWCMTGCVLYVRKYAQLDKCPNPKRKQP
jgi:hypothetical protein